jgi:hypothetical protein
MMDDLRRTLETEVIEPIFRGLAAQPRDASLPDVVFENRRRRARMRLLDALVSRGSAKVPPEAEEKVRSLARKWADKSFDDGFREVEDFEIESARERDLVAALESGDAERVRAVHERRLRQRVIRELGQIEIRGIQTAHRVLQSLEEVYVPLHLDQGLQTKIQYEIGGQKQWTLALENWTVTDALEKHRRILVVGAPGSGKSTLVAYLATRAAAGQLAGELGETKELLPLVLAVRSLSQAAFSELGLAEHLETDPELLEHTLAHGNAILFLDGVDEAPEALREKLISAVAEFAERYPDVRIMATSRPAGEPGEIEHRLSCLTPFRLAELTLQEVEEFIDKWCLAAETSVREDRSAAEKEASRAAEDLKSRVARSRSVQRIAVNPLLASILCVVHRFLGHTPEHRVTLYEKCTDALLYEWDQAKFGDGEAAIGRLDAEAKRSLLMGVASALHEEHEAEIDWTNVVQHFAKALPSLGRPVDEAEKMVVEIRDRSGLLVETGSSFFSFSHLTFQEYLTALHFVRSKDDRKLGSLIDRWENPWWHEVIVLAAGVPGSDSGQIVSDLLTKGERGAVLLAAQCVETAIEVPVKVRQEVEKQLERFVPPDDPESADELGRLGKVVAPILAKALPRTVGYQRAFTLWALKGTEYSPAIPAIVRCVSDRSSTEFLYYTTSDSQERFDMTIGELATKILASSALESDTGRLALRQALREIHSQEYYFTYLADWLRAHHSRSAYYEDVKKMIDDARKGAPRDVKRMIERIASKRHVGASSTPGTP